MTEERPRTLVVDTSVAVKFYIPEDDREKARKLLSASRRGQAEPLAPSTIFPEGFSAIFRQVRRGMLEADEARRAWESMLRAPVYTYAPEELIERSAELHFEIGASIYDALFLALAEDAETVMVTADDKLLRRIENTNFANLALHLASVERVL